MVYDIEESVTYPCGCRTHQLLPLDQEGKPIPLVVRVEVEAQRAHVHVSDDSGRIVTDEHDLPVTKILTGPVSVVCIHNPRHPASVPARG